MKTAPILATNPLLVEATSGNVPWPEALQRAIRQPERLLSALNLSLDELGPAEKVALAEQKFPLLVPWEFVARMRSGDPDDPLLRQVLVTSREADTSPGYVSDPVDDRAAEILPGLLQKYASRALLITTGACAVHCRYCFRREYPYSQAPKSPASWLPALDHIRRDTTLEEVILSGGDPLMLADTSLAWLVEKLNAIRHIVRLRIHTRMPVVIPQRVTETMLNWLRDSRMQVIIVTHINHPREVDSNLRAALARMRSTNAIMLNQAVLLREINDTVDVQRQLSENLISAGVLPYYLHQLDRVQGAAHFEVPITNGNQIITSLRAQISGYAVPKYVAEVAGQASKTPL